MSPRHHEPNSCASFALHTYTLTEVQPWQVIKLRKAGQLISQDFLSICLQTIETKHCDALSKKVSDKCL